jgi:hypothetical protein
MRSGTQYPRPPPLELSVDMDLLEENLRRTPGERLQWMMKILRVVHYVEVRMFPEEARRQWDAEDLVAKFGDLLKDAGP